MASVRSGPSPRPQWRKIRSMTSCYRGTAGRLLKMSVLGSPTDGGAPVLHSGTSDESPAQSTSLSPLCVAWQSVTEADHGIIDNPVREMMYDPVTNDLLILASQGFAVDTADHRHRWAGGYSAASPRGGSAARIIARMPALTGPDSSSHRSAMNRRSGSTRPFSGSTAAPGAALSRECAFSSGFSA